MKTFTRLLSATVGCAAFLAGAPAHADDSEVFTNATVIAAGAKPNVLFIVDTSGSMDTLVNVFNPAKSYSGACDPNKIYWRTEDTNTPPDCATTTQWVSVSNNRCRAAATGMGSSGWWRGRTQQLIRQNAAGNALNPTFWGNAVPGYDSKLECRDDDQVHGDLPGTTAPGGENKRARNGSGISDTNRWGNNGAGSLLDWSTKQRISMYSGNYANWYASTDGGDVKTRLEIVRDVAKDLITNLDGVNLGIMRYDDDAHGGMVAYPVSELNATTKQQMKDMLDSFNASGFTPLSETMYEAFRYLSGRRVDFGDNSEPMLSHFASRVGGVGGAFYDSPMDFSCQTTYIVYLTDGLPTMDNESDAAIEARAGACPARIDDPDPSHLTSGRCLETLTKYMHETDLRTDITGNQRVTTYFIGFGEEVAKSASFMNKVAIAGGTGHAYTQNDSAGLAATLEEIFTQVQDAADTTFVAPAVSVNAFNRSQNLNELYVSVFSPSKNMHWAGNLKKYRIYKDDIYGVSGSVSAIAADGFFADGSQAINSDGVVDGSLAAKGGAAGSLPSPDARKLYTYIAGNSTDLTNADNALVATNTMITDAMVGAVDAAERALIINYARGLDIHDENKNNSRTDQHNRMGDPMHARPAILIHGGTADKPEGTIFVPTNDGFLHAFAMNSSSADTSGNAPVTPTVERWAFVPQEFLQRLGPLFDDGSTVNRDYALDGDVRVFKFDVDQDGLVEPGDGDKAYIIFGTGRGGSAYYALDVTNPSKPVYRWRISNGTSGMGKLGRTWSTPQIARVNISGVTQNAQKLVLIFGGGYDTGQDADPATFSYITEDSVGNAIFMVDLETGARLWMGSKTSTPGALWTHADMTHSIPGNISVLDTNGDLFADRMYAADMGGQVWRFDIFNGKGAAELVAGGVLASLGNKALTTKTVESNRRFYYAPDVSVVTARGSRPYMNLAIGSGYRGHPLNKKTQDSFYSLRDYSPFIARDQASYNAATSVKDGDAGLVDVTTNLNATVGDSAAGWKLRLSDPSWRGEKVLAQSVTAGGIVMFTTYTPLDADPNNPCLANSLNRAYQLKASNGAPFGSVRFHEISRHGISPGITVIKDPAGNNDGDTDGDGDVDADDDDGDDKPLCLSGTKVLADCPPIGATIRSYWERK
jgi:type IV pilus assembly protein PilY1